ncbi:MAG: glycerate kinase [Opitutales bacterium]|nr:glycerate kinase [Opitutales bacterium]
MHALLAFDKFKHSMTAAEACAAAADSLRLAQPAWNLQTVPLTDGGEGFAEILTRTLGGDLHFLTVTDALFRPKEAVFGIVPYEHVPVAARERLRLPGCARLAVVEMAQAAGIEGLDESERDPWSASTFGVGELLKAAIEAGADAILLGVGGSATNDLGVGALEALGVIAYGHDLQPRCRLTPQTWKDVASLGGLYNVSNFPPVRIACDVDNPLTGERGATAVFGPQKGLRADDFVSLERAVNKMADRLLGLCGVPEEAFAERKAAAGSGAAGGIGFGLSCALPDVAYISGFPLFADWCDLQTALRGADWILTGEGRFDASSLGGKGPSAILAMAGAGTRVKVFAGSVDEALRRDPPAPLSPADIIAISPPDLPLAQALREAPDRLAAAVKAAFSHL